MPLRRHDGVYAVHYSGPGREGQPQGEAVIILRNGNVFGSDPSGLIFEGYVERDFAGRTLACLRLRVPPHGELVTGFVAGPEGATVSFAAVLRHEGSGRLTSATCEIAGAPVSVGIQWIGQLPR